MKSQQKLIFESNWSNLIILDACRYDFFKSVYKGYLGGKLEKCYSKGSNTPEWITKTFKRSYSGKLVYISANPFINSFGIEVEKNLDATDYFYKIFDVWDDYWNDQSKTVLPKSVSKVTRKIRMRYPDKKIISHYMQPHYPFLSVGPINQGVKKIFRRAKGEKQKNSLFEKIRSKVGRFFNRFLGFENSFRIRGSLRMRKLNPIELFEKKYGRKALLKAYQSNLRIVLEKVSVLVKKIPGKCIVTSDHGELLGEYGLYEHPKEINKPTLRTVPWLEVETEK